MKLSDLCNIRTDFQNADFWVTRRGSVTAVGKPTRVFSPEAIGVKVIDMDKLDPRYLFYWFEFLHMNRVFERMATGTLKLVHIRTKDIADLPVSFGGMMSEGIYDEPEEQHGSYGWWVFPDGRIEEMEEAGNHGMIADAWLSNQMSIEVGEYEEAIHDLIQRGGVRVATFHGSPDMGIDFPPKLEPVVRNALLKLLRETRGDFRTYFVGYGLEKPYNFRDMVKYIRAHP